MSLTLATPLAMAQDQPHYGVPDTGMLAPEARTGKALEHAAKQGQLTRRELRVLMANRDKHSAELRVLHHRARGEGPMVIRSLEAVHAADESDPEPLFALAQLTVESEPAAAMKWAARAIERANEWPKKDRPQKLLKMREISARIARDNGDAAAAKAHAEAFVAIATETGAPVPDDIRALSVQTSIRPE